MKKYFTVFFVFNRANTVFPVNDITPTVEHKIAKSLLLRHFARFDIVLIGAL